jgi:hypothetical protein
MIWTMPFRLWIEQHAVPSGRVGELGTILIGASGGLADFLNPAPGGNHTWTFLLREYVLIARKS